MRGIGVQSARPRHFNLNRQGDGLGRLAKAGRGDEIPGLIATEARRIEGKALTRHTVVSAVKAHAQHLSRREIRDLLDCLLREMTRVLATGEAVKLHGFGVFSVRRKSQRFGRNPRTGESAPVEARKVIVFKASEKMKEAVNGR